ncbi:MAG: hypothetical protein EA397_08350 [Deltaproteobacteria bacterium]|nr:MAG: hypothetical protein EA397_08350 [Deltaproteobacteria bacterium]
MDRALFLFPLLAGCWVTSEQVAAKVADLPTEETESDPTSSDPTEVVPLRYAGLAPVVGSNGGATEVTIQVGPVDPSDISVTFGGVQASVVSATEDQVVVLTPAVAFNGSVDVVIASRGELARATEAFYYWPDGSGRTGLVGVVSNHDYGRPYIPPPEFDRSASLVWIEPSSLRWWELYAPTIDTCVRDYEREGPRINFIEPGLSAMTLSGPTGDHALLPDSDGEFFGFYESDATFSYGATYDVEQPEGAVGFPELLLEDAVPIPEEGFEVFEPAMQNDTLATLPPFSSINLRWRGGESGDYVLIRARRYASVESNSVVADTITCAVFDDGQHLISNALWSAWDPDELIEISVGRAIEGQVRLPTNNAEGRIYGIQWWYGALMQGN